MNLNKSEQITGTIISILALLLFFVYIIIGSIGLENETLLLILLGSVAIVLTIICYLVFYKLRKSNKLIEIDYLNIGTQRYILGIFMVFYGLPKLFGAFFDYQLSALDTKLVDVTEFELAWYYFGKNNWQELVSGILEFVPGLLLFHRRTYYLASLILLFVTSQVFILNFFFKIGGITFPAATILLACNIYIIYSQKQNIIKFFKSLNFSINTNFTTISNKLIKTLKVIGITILAFVIFIKVKPNLFKSEYEKKYETLVGKYSLESVVKNNVEYIPKNDSTLYKELYIEKQSRWNLLRDFRNYTSPYLLEINKNNDSINLYLNRGGTGDDLDIIDSLTVLRGQFKLTKDELKIEGIQNNDTLKLTYRRQDLKPKKWLW